MGGITATRNEDRSSQRAGGTFSDQATSSPTSGPDAASNASSRSRALRASGPCTDITTPGFGIAEPGKWPLLVSAVSLGL